MNCGEIDPTVEAVELWTQKNEYKMLTKKNRKDTVLITKPNLIYVNIKDSILLY